MKYLIFTAIILLFSCKKNNNEANFTIKANIKNIKDSTKVFLFNIRNQKIIDSTFTKNENFIFSGELKDSSPGIIFFEGDYKYPRIIFWIDTNEETKIEFDVNQLKEIKTLTLAQNCIKTSHLNRIFSNYQKEISKIYEQQDKEIKSSNDKEIINIYDKYNKIRKNKYIDLIYNKPNNAIAVNRILDYMKEISKDSLIAYYNNLDSQLKNTEDGQVLYRYLYQEKVDIGDQMYAFDAIDLNKENINIERFKGNLILLNFWSSTCAPCRVENKKDFPQLLKKYKNEDFVMISFSLDRNIENWKSATKQDQITWINLTDLKGNNSEIIDRYNINSMPTTFLIDKKGVIISKVEGNVKNILPELHKEISREE